MASIRDLPDEVVVHVLSFVGLRDIALSVALVNSRWAQLATDETLWAALAARLPSVRTDREPGEHQPTGGWRAHCKQFSLVQRWVERMQAAVPTAVVYGHENLSVGPALFSLRGRTGVSAKNRSGVTLHNIGPASLKPDVRERHHLCDATANAWAPHPVKEFGWKGNHPIPSLDIAAGIRNQELMAVGVGDGKIRLIHMPDSSADSSVVCSFEAHETPTSQGEYVWDRYGVSCVRFAEEDKRLFSSSTDNTVKVWDVESAQRKSATCVHTFKHGDNTTGVFSVAATTDGQQFVSGGHLDNKFWVWDVRTDTRTAEVKHPNQPYIYPQRMLQYLFGGTHVLMGGDTYLALYDLRKTDEPVFNDKASGHRGSGMRDIFFNDHIGMSVSIYGDVTVWETATMTAHQLEQQWQFGSGPTAVHFDREGSTVAVAYTNPHSGWSLTKLVVMMLDPPDNPKRKNKKKDKKGCVLS